MDRMGWMVRMHKDGLLDEPFLKNHTLPRVHVFLVIFHSTNHHRPAMAATETAGVVVGAVAVETRAQSPKLRNMSSH